MFQLHIKESKITSINKINIEKEKISINDKTCFRFVSNKNNNAASWEMNSILYLMNSIL